MSIKTKIEWCDSTVNPIIGCTGCALRKDHCYAAVLCARYAGRKGWPKSFDSPEFFPGRLEKAAKWSDLTGKARLGKPWLDGLPRIVFVNDLSDGFCPDVDAELWLAPYLDMIAQSPHIWLLLTKWPKRMHEFFQRHGFIYKHVLPDNVWLGVSVENPDYLWRVDELMKCPAVVRFISLEPLLGPISLRPHTGSSRWLGPMPSERFYGKPKHDIVTGETRIVKKPRPILNWVIVGGESGPGARPMHPDWARDIRDQCQAADVPFFFKQWGAWMPIEATEEKLQAWVENPIGHRFCWLHSQIGHPASTGLYADHQMFERMGKKRAGRLLDGRTWDEMPRVREVIE